MATIVKTEQSHYQLLAQRIPASPRFILTVLENGRVQEIITATSAQLLLDYVQSEWPSGTRVQWVIT